MRGAICIFPSSESTHKQLTRYMIEYTDYYAHRLKKVLPEIDIVHAKSIDRGLKKYYKSYDHILFMAAGCRTYDESIIIDIQQQIINNPDYLVAAHILDWTKEDKWYELHQQFVLININTWNDINQPKFGGWHIDRRYLPVIERSKENFHDHYTPLWIKDSGQREVQRSGCPGWNLINQGLKMGCDIINWNEKIRSKRTYYYPETDSVIFWNAITHKKVDPKITNFNQKQLLHLLARGVQDQVWVLNSEGLQIDHNNRAYDIIALPASGFKYLDISYRNMLTQDGEIVIYDYNQISLDWITHLYEQTTTDINELIRSFDNNIQLIWAGIDNKPIVDTRGQINPEFTKQFTKVVNHFAGPNTFVSLLSRFRNSNVKFVLCDIVNSPRQLIDCFDNKETLFHISNIFATDWLIATYGLKKSARMLDDLLDSLASNVRVTGISSYCYDLPL